jgi:hypothetical protein
MAPRADLRGPRDGPSKKISAWPGYLIGPKQTTPLRLCGSVVKKCFLTSEEASHAKSQRAQRRSLKKLGFALAVRHPGVAGLFNRAQTNNPSASLCLCGEKVFSHFGRRVPRKVAKGAKKILEQAPLASSPREIILTVNAFGAIRRGLLPQPPTR